MNVAAIDLGTNSVRLLVTDASGCALERRADITRLGAGLPATGRLSAAGCDATVALLRQHRRLLDRHVVTALRVVATAAARRASDASSFLERAADAIGAPIEILSGDDEGRLSFAGATADLAPADGPFLVVDVGGGSTELVVGTTRPAVGAADGVEAAMSIDLGCVTLTEAELHHDPPLPEELANAVGAAADALADAWRLAPALRQAATLVGVGGTITTLAAVELGLSVYDRDRVHGLLLERAMVEDAFRALATEALVDRVHNPGLPRDRADVIVAGLCIVVALMRNLPAAEMRVSDADLLDALAASLRP